MDLQKALNRRGNAFMLLAALLLLSVAIFQIWKFADSIATFFFVAMIVFIWSGVFLKYISNWDMFYDKDLGILEKITFYSIISGIIQAMVVYFLLENGYYYTISEQNNIIYFAIRFSIIILNLLVLYIIVRKIKDVSVLSFSEKQKEFKEDLWLVGLADKTLLNFYDGREYTDSRLVSDSPNPYDDALIVFEGVVDESKICRE